MTSKLENRAMLVEVNVKFWKAKKLDKAVSRETNARYDAKDGASRTYKSLVARDALDRIVKVNSKIITYHYEKTLRWNDNGLRIIPTALILEYTAEMKKLKHEFIEVVEEFLTSYGDHVEEARTGLLGEMFKVSDYPSPNEIADKFQFTFRFYPVPTEGDFRVTLSDEFMDEVRSELEEQIKQVESQAVTEVWERLYKVVEHMVTILSKDKPKIYPSLIGNIVKLTALLPKLNLTGNPELEQKRQEIEGKLAGLNTETLKSDETARKDAVDKAQAILDSMAGYIGGSK